MEIDAQLDKAARRRAANPKTVKHPFAAVEHRVLDSDAYRDLNFSAQALLFILARQLTRTNNGHLNCSFKFCQRYGFGSEHTLAAAVADLISHGFIYRTRSHGANKVWARYAVSWKSITEREGLFLAGFVPCAWQHWKPGSGKKSTPQKVQQLSSRKCSFTSEFPAENAGSTPAKSAEYEVNTNVRSVAPPLTTTMPAWMADDLRRLADAGLAGWNCYQVPLTSTVRMPARASRHH